MPSLYTLRVPSAAPPGLSANERFARALVGLTRTVWHPDCTFETALKAIGKAAAETLDVGRVSVWAYDRDAGLLRCLHVYDAVAGGPDSTDESLETLSLVGDDYMAAFKDVRTFALVDFASDPAAAGSHEALRSYLQRHRIVSVLDAPAYVEGMLQAVISHESVGCARLWSRDEVTFAGSMGDYVAMAYEISRRRSVEAEIAHLRLHDAATGLPNRDYMVELIRQSLAPTRRIADALALVHVYIDASGGIAWSAGAPTVDEVITTISQRLDRLSGEVIHLARVRANGFAFLVPHHGNPRSAIRLAERALAAVRSLVWNHDEVDPSAAVGIAFAHVGADNDARVLMRQAEEAANHALAGDKFGYAVFDPEHHATLVEALRFERALRDAFANGDFEVHYQPEYDASRHAWVAGEALLRWRRDDQLMVAGDFIEVVESSGLVIPVGRWVLSQACRDAMTWPRMPDGGEMVLRVNVSARQFEEEELVDDVNKALSDSGLAPARLCLELTETTLMRDIDHALGVLNQLKTLGVKVAIDDFGIGYASLVYLRRLPVDVLKIDRSFVQGLPGAVADAAIVRAMVGLAESLHLEVVAEGVELPEQQDALQKMGVRNMQGWLYGKAMELADFCRLLEAPAPLP